MEAFLIGLLLFASEFLSLTTDILSRCVFGTRINSIEDKDSIFVENIKKLTFGDGDADIMFSLVCKMLYLSDLKALFEICSLI